MFPLPLKAEYVHLLREVIKLYMNETHLREPGIHVVEMRTDGTPSDIAIKKRDEKLIAIT